MFLSVGIRLPALLVVGHAAVTFDHRELLKKNEVGRACSEHEDEGERIQDFAGKTRRNETIRKT
jgi:hypothetical protein